MVNDLYAMISCDRRQTCFSGFACAGVAATVVNDAVMVPADVIKQRLQVSQGQYKGVLDCITQTWRHEGMTGFYRQKRSWQTSRATFRMACAGSIWHAGSHIIHHHVTDIIIDVHASPHAMTLTSNRSQVISSNVVHEHPLGHSALPPVRDIEAAHGA